MPDGLEIVFDDADFTEALSEYVGVTSKTLTEAINAKAKDVCFKAANETIKPSEVSANIKRYPKGTPLWHALAATGATKYGKAVRGEGNKKLANKIYNSRIRATGFSRAIWRKIASDFGASLRGKAAKISAARGIKARKSHKPFAVLLADDLEVDHVRGVMQPAVDRALKHVARDMVKYLSRKMGEQRLSPRLRRLK